MLNHFDRAGNAIMVDVSGKEITSRCAVAQGEICLSPAALSAVQEGKMSKGDVLGVARIAGIMASKRTWELIPMCHPLMLTHATVEFEIVQPENIVRAICTVKTDGKTGVEMEALTGVSVALLTIYDMCKAVDKSMVVRNIHLVEKTGGKSGTFRKKECEDE